MGKRILCVDNYDSFVYTIVGYMSRLGASVDVMRNDEVGQRWRQYDGILISPGPGTPKQAGQCGEIIEGAASLNIPLLGVCLGHQALAEVYGATVTHAAELMHGKTSLITHDGEGIFTDLPSPLRVTRYHSLAVAPHSLTDDLVVTASTDDGEIMALRHRERPLFGVQFHPESILTQDGHRIIANWLDMVGIDEARAIAHNTSFVN
ncbi:MAG: aminodeoxychorismate/anthranilate synthase component II [Actinomycetaceae bacterium]|nr:aminodeoxychorismate/anthranilate synthase component II [Actinomycetaceae bacterium]